MKTIEDRIIDLDKKCKHPSGFSLSRSFAPISGVIWSIGVGQIGGSKKFYDGLTLEEVISKAENDL